MDTFSRKFPPTRARTYTQSGPPPTTSSEQSIAKRALHYRQKSLKPSPKEPLETHKLIAPGQSWRWLAFHRAEVRASQSAATRLSSRRAKELCLAQPRALLAVVGLICKFSGSVLGHFYAVVALFYLGHDEDAGVGKHPCVSERMEGEV